MSDKIVKARVYGARTLTSNGFKRIYIRRDYEFYRVQYNRLVENKTRPDEINYLRRRTRARCKVIIIIPYDIVPFVRSFFIV
jgi:hypothetical protein